MQYSMHGAKHQLAHALISGRGVIIKSGAARAAPAAPTPTALGWDWQGRVATTSGRAGRAMALLNGPA